MSEHSTAAIILAAGLGTRMKSDLPKVMHPLAGRPMIRHLLDTLESLGLAQIVVVAGEDGIGVGDAVTPHPVAIQHERLGTANAVQAARGALEGFDGDVLVTFGADPLIRPQTIEAMLARRRADDDPAVVVLGFRPQDPTGYGRLVVDGDGNLQAIVEHKDATEEQRAIELCNSGVMAIDGKRLFDLVDRVDNDNAKGEFYLTDIVALARGDGAACGLVEGTAEELHGVDSRADLADAEWIVQEGIRSFMLDNGVTLLDPATVHFSFDTQIGRDTVVEPHVVFAPGVTVGSNVTIKSFSHLEGAAVADGAQIGPFARLRPGAMVGEGARVGNYVEVKNATLEAGAKVNHLTYIGDARVGAKANIGAGTITCNYDGFFKSYTDIGAGAFIGSNTALVAPVKVGDGAIVGAGSVVSKDVPGDALAVTRAPQKDLVGWAKNFRERKSAEKKAKQKKG